MVGPFFSPINLTSLTQIATIQSKNLTKTIKTLIHNVDCILAKKKKNYFISKKPSVIGKGKAIFFATTIN